MHMETLNYPIAQSPVIGSAPMSSPMCPTESERYSTDCQSQLYSDTPYVENTYHATPIHDPYSSKFDVDDTNNNNSIYSAEDKEDFYGDSLDSGFSNLSICHEEDTAPFSCTEPSTSVESLSSDHMKRSKKSCRSKAKSSTGSISSSDSSRRTSRSSAKSSTGSNFSEDSRGGRKDSFVYDVRLPDEQFLFFVPDLDLVKSHLMMAVREEVDVLKDKIVELMDRINHLECENSMLRQYASPEVLQQIQAQLPHQIQQPSHHSSTS